MPLFLKNINFSYNLKEAINGNDYTAIYLAQKRIFIISPGKEAMLKNENVQNREF